MRRLEDHDGVGALIRRKLYKRIVQHEASKTIILIEKEEIWTLKSRVVWLKSGDENTFFFQNFAKDRKEFNTIWALDDPKGGFYFLS